MVLDPQRWLELRRFRGLVESGAMSLSEVAKETGLNWRTVSKYLSADSSAPPRRMASGQPRKRVVDEVAPLIDAILRAEILMRVFTSGFDQRCMQAFKDRSPPCW